MKNIYLVALSIILCGYITQTASYPRMKILMVTSVFPKLSEPFILDQAVGLLERGQDVFIYAKSAETTKVHSKVVKYGLIERTYYDRLPPDIDTFDLILCQFGPRGNEFMRIKKQLNLRAKLVTYFRGYDITEFVNKYPGCYDKLFSYGDFFIANCDYFRRKAINLGCDEKKIIVHYSAIDCDWFSYKLPTPLPKGEKIRIITTGRLVEKKGIEYALYAIDTVRKKFNNIEYHIVGDGSFKQRLERFVSELKLEKYVTFRGAYTQDELADILSHAHIFVLPSVTAKNTNQDAIPNVLKEAMAIGLPVVSTHHGGISEMITHGKNGFLVPERDSKALAEKLELLVQNSSMREELGLAGYRTVEARFETTQLNNRLVEILYSIVKGEKPSTFSD